MTKLTIVAFDGTSHDLEVANGSTVMENAVRNSVPGIEAECGGACACATCHVYVDDAWTAAVGTPEAMEEDMLDFAYDVRPTSRLSCQIKMSDALDGLESLFAELGRIDRNFLVFIDELGFGESDDVGPRHLRSWLEGGVEARPANVRLAVTSNRRAIVARQSSEQDDPLNPRDVVDDRLALADRFGLSLGFHNCSQDDYLAIVGGYAGEYGLDWDEAGALEWSKRRGARSGRTAWQYVTELAGRAGKSLSPRSPARRAVPAGGPCRISACRSGPRSSMCSCSRSSRCPAIRCWRRSARRRNS